MGNSAITNAGEHYFHENVQTYKHGDMKFPTYIPDPMVGWYMCPEMTFGPPTVTDIPTAPGVKVERGWECGGWR